jgi:VIT1/CCC1 family predicted Fe2+/Mn2+ transporter/rubrerythrin
MSEIDANGEKTVPIERLLTAWRGEVEAEAVYSVLAARETDRKRTVVLERMASAEVKHRRRIEQRLSELGVAPPDPAKVGISRWLRLQAWLAPRDRLLARMEANEQDEITDRYERPTGDKVTDELFHSIRSEEQSHSRRVRGLRASEVVTPPAASVALQRILGRETWHRTGSGWISGAIYGANDGLAAVFGIVAGVSGATGGSSFVLTAGLFGAIASGLSMATGAFLAERSTSEVALANIEGERRELNEHPEEEKEEVSLFYQLKGLSKIEADQLAERLAQNQESMLQVLVTEELGGSKAEGSNPAQSAAAAGVSTFIGAMIPVLPFFWLHGVTAVATAAVVSLVAHFLVGAAKSLFTLRSWWSAGLEMTAAGVVVGGITYAVGLFVH